MYLKTVEQNGAIRDKVNEPDFAAAKCIFSEKPEQPSRRTKSTVLTGVFPYLVAQILFIIARDFHNFTLKNPINL